MRQGYTSSGTVDILAVFEWLQRNPGYMVGDPSVTDVQFGYEITSSPGNVSFTTTNYPVVA